MKTKVKKEKGAVETKRVKPQFKSLHELFNFGDKAKYEVSNVADYKSMIGRMNIGDLQIHAVKLGLKPSRNRAMLEKTLLNAFSKHFAGLVPPVASNSSMKNYDQVMEILSRGK